MSKFKIESFVGQNSVNRGAKTNRCFDENLKFWEDKRKKYDITKLVAI
jgi:hypothetical protein